MGWLSSLFGIDSAKDTISQANDYNINEARGAYGDVKGLYDPYYQGGTKANSRILDLLGLNGVDAGKNAMSTFQTSPGYDWRMQQGVDAIDRSKLHAGGGISGATLKDLNTFGQGQASGEYGNWLNNLFNVSGQGLTAAGGTANARMGTSQQIIGSNSGAANAMANAELSKGSILSGLLNSGLKMFGYGYGGGFGSPFGGGNQSSRYGDPSRY